MKTLETRQQEAATRQVNARSPQAQLQYLDAQGLKATRERAKLAKKLAPKTVVQQFDEDRKAAKTLAAANAKTVLNAFQVPAGLLTAPKTPEGKRRREATNKAFNATPKELGQAAVKAAATK